VWVNADILFAKSQRTKRRKTTAKKKMMRMTTRPTTAGRNELASN
jgi:hypothetical protein